MPIVDTSIIKEFELFDVYQKESEDPQKNLVFAICQSWKKQTGHNDMVWMEMDPQPKAKMILDFIEIAKNRWPKEKVEDTVEIKLEKTAPNPVERIKTNPVVFNKVKTKKGDK